MWTFKDKNTIFGSSYFIKINETWVNHKESSKLAANQVANYGVDSFYKFIGQVGQEIILFAQSFTNNGNPNPYYKLNSSVLVLGNCYNSSCSSNPSNIEWIDSLSYQGSWAIIYPGFSFILFFFFRIVIMFLKFKFKVSTCMVQQRGLMELVKLLLK